MSGKDPPPKTHPPEARWKNFDKESQEDRQKRYALIFSKLDRNQDGTICISDLQEVMANIGSKNPAKAAEVNIYIIIIFKKL